MTLALIDGDIIAFRAAAGSAQSYFDDDAPVANEVGAADAAAMAVDAWAKIAGCKDVCVTFSGAHNFRKLILPTYKASRAGKGKPPGYWATVASVSERFPTQTVDGLEGDDLLGILATTDKYREASIILSEDKDMKTIPTRVMRPLRDRKPVAYAQHEADYYWLMQTLTGDSTDEYKGIPGMGPKGAEKLLGATPPRTPVENLWGRVAAAYSRAGLTQDEAHTQARCARILRREDYDKATKEILLWHLTTPVRLSLATVCGASGPTAPTN